MREKPEQVGRSRSMVSGRQREPNSKTPASAHVEPVLGHSTGSGSHLVVLVAIWGVGILGGPPMLRPLSWRHMVRVSYSGQSGEGPRSW